MMNSFSGIGRLGSDPSIYHKEEKCIAKFSIAINEFYKKDTELQKKTHWIPCVAYGRLAEITEEYLKKGSQVGVRGPLKLRQWNGEKGDKMSELQVNILELEFLSSKQPV